MHYTLQLLVTSTLLVTSSTLALHIEAVALRLGFLEAVLQLPNCVLVFQNIWSTFTASSNQEPYFDRMAPYWGCAQVKNALAQVPGVSDVQDEALTEDNMFRCPECEVTS